MWYFRYFTRCNSLGILPVGEIGIGVETGNQLCIADAVFRREQAGSGNHGNMGVRHGKMLFLLRLRFLMALEAMVIALGGTGKQG